MYRKYFKEKHAIPKNNLVEIKYEDFLARPFHELKHIYSRLNLSMNQQAQTKFQTYLSTQKQIKQHKYHIEKVIKNRLYQKWKFIFNTLGYDA
jgi:hypothetical protein